MDFMLLDGQTLWRSIFAFLIFNLGSGLIAGYIAGRWDELGWMSVPVGIFGFGLFFLLLVTYTLYLKVVAFMPTSWTATLMWGHYPAMIGAVALGWYIAEQRKNSTGNPTQGRGWGSR